MARDKTAVGNALKECLQLGCGNALSAQGTPRRWKPEALAPEIHVSRHAISSWCEGRRGISRENFDQLLIVLRTPSALPAAPREKVDHDRALDTAAETNLRQSKAVDELEAAYYPESSPTSAREPWTITMPTWTPEHPDYRRQMKRLSIMLVLLPGIVVFAAIATFHPSFFQQIQRLYKTIQDFNSTLINYAQMATLFIMLILIFLWSYYGQQEVDLVKEWLSPRRFDLKGQCLFLLHFVIIFVVLAFTLTSICNLQDFARWFALYCFLDRVSWAWRRAYLRTLLFETRGRLDTANRTFMVENAAEKRIACDAFELYYINKAHGWRIAFQGLVAASISISALPSAQDEIISSMQYHLEFNLSREHLLSSGYIILIVVILFSEIIIGRWRASLEKTLETQRQQILLHEEDQYSQTISA